MTSSYPKPTPRGDAVLNWLSRLNAWPIRTWTGYLYYVFVARGSVAIITLAAGEGITYGPEVLLTCALFVGALALLWPKESK